MIIQKEEQNVSILGIPLKLDIMDRSMLRGINADMLLNLTFYEAKFHEERICVIKVKNEKRYSPLKYKKLTEQIEKILHFPVVLLLNPLPYYERERLISQGVYFIISDKYAFLPTLVANVRSKQKTKVLVKLTPAAQYILLYYLLQEDRNRFTIAGLEQVVPYNYLAIARAVVVLEETGLCKVETDQRGIKHIQFDTSKRMLWNKAQNNLSSPVKKIVFADNKPDVNLSVSGSNALSHYSHLNPEQYGNIAIWDKDFNDSAIEYNEIEGLYTMEIWKYPTEIHCKQDGYVDKLSLYLSLRENPDPRIEKELEMMIEELEW